MAGSIGIVKYKKYFHGQTIDTIVQVDAPLYDLNDPKKKIAALKKGTAITVLPKKKWEDHNKMYPVRLVLNGKKLAGLLADGSVAKPVAKTGVGLKPQYLGIQENPTGYLSPEILQTILKSLENRDDLNPYTKMYMVYLLEQTGDASKKTVKFENLNLKKIPQADLNQIKRDFGEIIGALSVVNDRSLFKSLDINKDSKIYYPTKGNEPLLDFRVITRRGPNDIKYTYSSKAGTSTNTLKPADILTLIERSDKIKEKWKNTLEYKILEMLRDNSIVRGPLEVCNYLNDSPQYKKFHYTKGVKGLILNSEKDEVKRTKPFISEVYQAEKHVVNVSRELNYTEMFFDAITGTVYYINLTGFDGRGLPIWKTSGESHEQDHKHAKKVVFRSKNSNNLMDNRLGLQM